MKKSFLMILGCLLTVALVFNACTQQEDLVESPIATVDEVATENNSFRMTLPSHLSNADADEVQQFIESLTQEELDARVESAKILNFLKEAGKLDRLVADQPDFDYLTQKDLAKYAGKMLRHYENYTPRLEGARGCVTLYSECNGSTLFILQRCCYGSYCDYANLYYFNHPSCSSNPCAGVNCPTNYTCINGSCVYQNPCAGITCPTNYTCINGACVYQNPCAGVNCPTGQTCNNGVCSGGPGPGDCNPPCSSGFCDNGTCCGGNTGNICN